MKPVLLVCAFILSAAVYAQQGQAQGAFQNLGFESATVVRIPDDPFGRIYLAQAFPGWRGYIGGVPETAAGYNGTFLCCSTISLFGGDNPALAIAGTYSTALKAALGDDGQPADTAIAQTGLVPVGAQSLLFKAQALGPFSVALAGQPLSVIALSSGPNYTLFGADISAWAGQASELRFTALATQPQGSFFVFDAVQFSAEPIPEPRGVVFVASAGLLACYYLRRKSG